MLAPKKRKPLKTPHKPRNRIRSQLKRAMEISRHAKIQGQQYRALMVVNLDMKTGKVVLRLINQMVDRIHLGRIPNLE